MNTAINIQNYEEFFLLYVDNELSAEERASVEAFVLAHPGLATELEMLQQAQLGAEAWVFEDKETLYRSHSEEIGLHNHEEHFLLYIDNELDARRQQEVETFVLQHPALQEGFTQLKQTRLEPETIVFRNKETLYRKEERERRMVYMRWQRLAVAAVFIGLAVAVWTILPSEKSSQQNLARIDNGARTAASPATDGKQTAPSNADPISSATTETGGEDGTLVPPQTAAQSSNKAGNIQPNTQASEAGIAANTPTGAAGTGIVEPRVSPNTAALASIEPPVQTERGETVNTGNRNRFETVAASTERVPETNTTAAQTLMASNTEAAVGGPNNIETQPAVYRELDTDDEKKSLLLGSIEINKDKLRGFFRKAGSIFRSKKADEERTESRPSSTTRSLK